MSKSSNEARKIMLQNISTESTEEYKLSKIIVNKKIKREKDGPKKKFVITREHFSKNAKK